MTTIITLARSWQRHRLFWPIGVLVALLLVNLGYRGSFFPSGCATATSTAAWSTSCGSARR